MANDKHKLFQAIIKGLDEMRAFLQKDPTSRSINNRYTTHRQVAKMIDIVISCLDEMKNYPCDDHEKTHRRAMLAIQELKRELGFDK